MKKVAMSVVTAVVFFMAMAYAQTSGSQTPDPNSGSQGTTQSSPSMSGSQNSGSMGQSSGEMKSEKSKGEKTLKGCIENENGTYKLDEKNGKEVTLTGADVSAHAGHEVKVHGSWESSSASPTASGGTAMGSDTSNTGSSAKSDKVFNVTSVDMVSETCKMKKSSKDHMGDMGGSGSGSTTPPPPK